MTERLKIDKTKYILKIKKVGVFSKFGVYLGKGFVDRISNWRYNYPSTMTLEIDTDENIQFLTFYLSFPPGSEGIIPITTEFTYKFSSTSNPYQIFSMLTTAYADNDGKMTILSFFQKVAKVIVPLGGSNLLTKRILNVESVLSDLVDSISELDILLASLQQIKDFFILGKFKIIEDDISTANFRETLPVFLDKFQQIKLIQNEIIYLPSDETSHIWLNQLEDSIFMVDAGFSPLVNGLNSLLVLHDSVKYLNIFITHFHLDHVQALAGLIKNTIGLKITVYIHKNISVEFLGWLLENYSHITISNKKISNFKIKIIEDGNAFIVNGVNSMAQPILHNKFSDNYLRHFITSITWVMYEDSKCLKIFSGDLNYQLPRPRIDNMKIQIRKYFEQVYHLVQPEKLCAHIFWDYGHLIEGNETFQDTLTLADSSDVKGDTINSAYYYEHIKECTGFTAVRVLLEQGIKQTKFFQTPPDYTPPNRNT